MSLSIGNNVIKSIYKMNSTGGDYGHAGAKYQVSSKGAFSCNLSDVGIDVFAPEDAMAIILLDPVRNLKWKIGGGDDITATCVAGSVFIIPPHHGLVITWPEHVEVLKINISKSRALARPIQDSESKIINLENIVVFSSKQCLQVSKLILDNLRDDDYPEEMYSDALYSVIVHLIAKNAVVASGSSGVQRGLSSYACRQIENYLKENFRRQISVPDMAATLGISAGHFATCFRESFGLTPHQYLMGLRLDEAEKCLAETDTTISEIAVRLNFSSQSHLTTALRKYRQITPGEIRRRGSRWRSTKT